MNLPNVMTVKEQRAIEPLLQNVEFWAPALREICQRESITFDQMNAGFESSSAVFILDDKYVVKIFTPYLHKTFSIEAGILEVLSHIPDIPSPKLHAKGLFEGRTEWPYLIMEFIPGQELREISKHIERKNLLEIAEEFGHIINIFHHIETQVIPQVEQIHGSFVDNLQSYRQSLEEALASIGEMKVLPQKRRLLSVSVLEEMEQLYRQGLMKYLDGQPVLAHCDLTEDHLILTEKNGKWHISGLIDYADAHIGLREFDWHDLWFCLWDRDAQVMRVFLTAYDSSLEIDAEFRRKCMFFATRHLPIHRRIKNALIDAGFPKINSLGEFLDLQWPPQLINALGM